MTRFIRLAFLLLLAGLGLLLCAVYVFRDTALQTAANAVLDDGIRVTAVRGFRLASGNAHVAHMELLLRDAGLHVTVEDIALQYRREGLFSLPQPAALQVASVLLRQEATSPGAEAADSAPPSLATILDLLRQFPLDSLSIDHLETPYWQQPLSLELDHREDGLQLALAGDEVAVSVLFAQAGPTSAARLNLTLTLAGETAGDLRVLLEPAGAVYRVSGSAHLAYAGPQTLPAQLRPALMALPLSAADLELVLDGEVANTSGPDTGQSPQQEPSPRVDFTTTLAAGSRFALSDGFVAGLDAAVLTLQESATVTVSTGAASTIATESLPLAVSARWQGQPLALDLDLRLPVCALAAPDTCAPAFSGSASLGALALGAEAGSVQAPALRGSGTVNRQGQTLTLTLDPGFSLSAAAVDTPTLRVEEPTLLNEGSLLLYLDTDTAALRLTADEFSGAFASLEAGDYRVTSAFTLRALELTFDDVPDLQFSLATHRLDVSGPQPWLPGLDTDGRYALAGNTLTFDTTLLSRQLPDAGGIRLQGHHDLANSTGAAQIALPRLAFSEGNDGLATWLGGWPWPADVVSGSITLDGELAWQPDSGSPADADTLVVTGNVSLQLSALAGFHDAVFFRGLDTALNARIDTSGPLPLSLPASDLRIAGVDAGLPLTDIATRFALDGGEAILSVDSLRIDVLGGTVEADDQRYDFDSPHNVLTLRFTALRLESLLDLVDYEGVVATGAVSGEVPLIITDAGVEVTEGRLYAEPPGGTIRYLDGANGGQVNPALALVNQALANYRFDRLDSSVDYTPDGELLLAMNLQGQNPDLNQGQRINLNLNLSNNIRDLLQSLQAGRAIEDFLQRQTE